ncbi:hypothetical protein E2C01_050156 [Portunus trituberculatus]|uniref:Uncharacterized protein n=1 Tax=Portunus trituberculatus TaxID=210409 RepID=A0A5B7GFS0_PORTR|nr:hypothetical protein [Portunus trituberculatus]
MRGVWEPDFESAWERNALAPAQCQYTLLLGQRLGSSVDYCKRCGEQMAWWSPQEKGTWLTVLQ